MGTLRSLKSGIILEMCLSEFDDDQSEISLEIGDISRRLEDELISGRFRFLSVKSKNFFFKVK